MQVDGESSTIFLLYCHGGHSSPPTGKIPYLVSPWCLRHPLSNHLHDCIVFWGSSSCLVLFILLLGSPWVLYTADFNRFLSYFHYIYPFMYIRMKFMFSGWAMMRVASPKPRKKHTARLGELFHPSFTLLFLLILSLCQIGYSRAGQLRFPIYSVPF